MGREECSVKCEVWRKQWEVRSGKCGVWSFSLECEERSVKCEVWGLECEGSCEKWEVWSVDCEVWSVECEVWSLECEECSVKCGVWSVKTLLRLSLKKTACRGKDTVGTGFSSNYRSFIFGKLPPPACPGLCYMYVYIYICICIYICMYIYIVGNICQWRLSENSWTNHNLASWELDLSLLWTSVNTFQKSGQVTSSAGRPLSKRWKISKYACQPNHSYQSFA